MEIDVKQITQRSKRRKRAQRMQAERGKEVVGGGEVDSGEEDYGSLKRDKTVRPPVRRKRNKDISPILEEDIIDGFAILAFKTYEDLEFAIKIASKRNEKRLSSIIELTKLMADENISDILSKSQKTNTTTEIKPVVRDLETDHKGKVTSYINQNAYCQDAGTSDDSGRASERLTTSSVAQRDPESSRDRLSDASSRCSSGKGYICDSEGDDDKVSDAGSGFSNTHAFIAKPSKPNSTPPLVENVSTNTSKVENMKTKTDLILDQKTVTELPPPALPHPLGNSQQIKQNQIVQVPISRLDEKTNAEENDLKSNTSINILTGVATVKTEEIKQDLKVQINAEKEIPSISELSRDTQLSNSDSNSVKQNQETDAFDTRIPVKPITTNDPLQADPTSSSFLYRSSYIQSGSGYSNYPYPAPSVDSKDNQLSPSTVNSKMSVPLLPVSSGSKEVLQLNKTDKIASSFALNPPKERDNFSDINSLSVSSVSSSSATVIQSIPTSKLTNSISFPRPLPTSAWPITSTQTEIPIVKPPISGSAQKSTPPPASLNLSNTATTTFATPLPPPTTTAPLSFSAESLFSTKPKDQTDLLRRELDSRFLDRAGLSNSSSNPPFLRQELHHHQHQHTHLHQHHQQIIPAVNPAPNTIFSTPLFKDIPKIGGVDSPFYRTGISMPMYTAYPPTILHPSMGAQTTQFIPQNSLSTFITKKTGRWNAMHVRIAWEIYSHQTKQNPEKTNALKATEVLRNPTHLHSPASGGLLRTHEMMPGSYPPPHLISGRNLFDSAMNPQFLGSSSHLGMSPFSRYSAPFPPSPFASMSGFSRDGTLGPPFTGLHDPWRSLQRPYLPTPAPPNWGIKSDVSSIEISKREAEERERQLRDRDERERLRREREEKERQREREREREEKLKKEERERKEKEKREQERREMERERMLQQQRMNEMKPNVQNNVICHDRSPLRNGCETDIRIKEESRKDEDVSRFSSPSNPMIGTPSHAYLSSRHPQHVLGVSPSHLSRSILPHPGTSLSHFPPPPSVWSGVDPYRDPYRLDPLNPLRYNPLMEAMRVEEERAKAMYAAHSAMHYRPKDPSSFPMLHHRMPSAPLKPNGPTVNLDTLKKDDSSQNR